MKVRDILEALEGVDPDTNISFQMRAGCCDEMVEMKDADIEVYQLTKDEKYVVVDFSPIAGYHSCLQMGQTIRNNDKYWGDKNQPKYMVNKPK